MIKFIFWGLIWIAFYIWGAWYFALSPAALDYFNKSYPVALVIFFIFLLFASKKQKSNN